MKFNGICGLPRSGSTLLCNLLNQNPRFYASSTSVIPQSVRLVSNFWSQSPELKSELINDKDGTELRMANVLRAFIGTWYHGKGEVVFDKSRAWNHNAPLFNQLNPEGHLFVCVRDLRSIFASMEKQHAKNPILDEVGDVLGRTVFNRADSKFSPEGIIGQQVLGVEDLIRRDLPFVHFIRYENFVQEPHVPLNRIYEAIGEEPCPHDFVDVKNTSTDVDALYLNKYPHEGSGEVKPPYSNWADYVSNDIANLIIQRFPMYNQTFGYY